MARRQRTAFGQVVSDHSLRNARWREGPHNDNAAEEPASSSRHGPDKETPRHALMLPPRPQGHEPDDECAYFALVADNGPKKRPPPLTAAEAYELALERLERYNIN